METREYAVVTGPLWVAPDGAFGFVRLGGEPAPYRYRDPDGTERTHHTAPEDVYVSARLIQTHGLEADDVVTSPWRQAVGGERFRSAIEVLAVNGAPPTVVN